MGAPSWTLPKGYGNQIAEAAQWPNLLPCNPLHQAWGMCGAQNPDRVRALPASDRALESDSDADSDADSLPPSLPTTETSQGGLLFRKIPFPRAYLSGTHLLEPDKTQPSGSHLVASPPPFTTASLLGPEVGLGLPARHAPLDCSVLAPGGMDSFWQRGDSGLVTWRGLPSSMCKCAPPAPPYTTLIPFPPPPPLQPRGGALESFIAGEDLSTAPTVGSADCLPACTPEGPPQVDAPPQVLVAPPSVAPASLDPSAAPAWPVAACGAGRADCLTVAGGRNGNVGYSGRIREGTAKHTIVRARAWPSCRKTPTTCVHHTRHRLLSTGTMLSRLRVSCA